MPVQPLEESAFYKDDYIGLRALNEAEKVQWVKIVGDHLQFSQEDMDNYFIPFLMS
jgi:palmitoyl-protein thioesterase